MWNDNPEVDLNINGGTLFIADQFDFGQANSIERQLATCGEYDAINNATNNNCSSSIFMFILEI